MHPRYYFVGVDGEQAVSSTETAKQIQCVRQLECCLVDSRGSKFSWDAFDNPEKPHTIFQAIMNDRKMRIDRGIVMADRPNFAVITAVDNQALRLEYYEGHDALALTYDIRSPELIGASIPSFMGSDPCAYDPGQFLEDAFGIPKEISEPLLKAIHKRMRKEEKE